MIPKIFFDWDDNDRKDENLVKEAYPWGFVQGEEEW